MFPELKKGDRGIAVVILQAWLSGAGFIKDGFVADGQYGDRTALAVQELRDYYDIDIRDGQFDRQVIERIKKSHPNSGVMTIDFDLFADFLPK